MIRVDLPHLDWYLVLSPQFQTLGSPWQQIAAALALILPVALLIWLYHYEIRLLRPFAGWSLAGLRLALILILWFVAVWQPVLARAVEEELPSRVVVLVDVSASMRITDPQRSVQEKQQVADALGLGLTGVDNRKENFAFVDRQQRLQIVETILSKHSGSLAQQLNRRHQLDVIGFHKKHWLTPINKKTGKIDRSIFNDKTNLRNREIQFTNLHAPLEQLLLQSGQKRGRIAAVLLFSDGRHNWGEEPSKLTAQLHRGRIPIYPVIVGGLHAPRDVSIMQVTSEPTNILKGADAHIKTLVWVAGLEKQDVNLDLYLNGKIQKTLRQVIKHQGADQYYRRRFRLPLKTTGTQKIEVRATPSERGVQEISRKNNAKTVVLRTSEDPAHVLVIDGETRWEQHFLMKALQRDEMIEPKDIVYVQPRIAAVDESVLEKAGYPWRHLPKWQPKSKTPDPLRNYDCIILGDVAPEHLDHAERLRLAEYVADFGGTLVFVAGKRWQPLHYVKNPLPKGKPDPLLPLLPLEKLRELRPITGFDLSLTSAGLKKPYLQLIRHENESEQLGAGAGKQLKDWETLPKHYWGVIGSAKPGATALAFVKSTGKRTLKKNTTPQRQRERAIIAEQRFGFGRVLFVGVGSTWRWRYRIGDYYHHQFWGQFIRWAASDKILPAGNKFVRYGVRKPSYSEGEKIHIDVRIEDDSVELSPKDKAQAQIFAADDADKKKPIAKVNLKRSARQPRVMSAVTDKLPPGEYRLRLNIPKINNKINDTSGEKNTVEQRGNLFMVLPSASSELMQLSVNVPLLQSLAHTTGGKLVRLDQLEELVRELENRIATRSQQIEQRVWQDAPLFWYLFGLFLFLVTLEWSLRKVFSLP